jgi:hypothetical protein
LKISGVNLKWGGNMYFHHSRRKELSKRIISLARTGCPITLTILKMCVFIYRGKNNIPNQFVKEVSQLKALGACLKTESMLIIRKF